MMKVGQMAELLLENKEIKNEPGKKISESVKVYRHEIKYYVSYTTYIQLVQILRKSLMLDPYSSHSNHYRVRSLYFDTQDNNDYYDKILGVSTRKKIRLRIYNESQEKVKLELKSKYNKYQIKETAFISPKDACALIGGNREVLLSYGNEVLNKIYRTMNLQYYRPVITVEYEREAYSCPIENTRITLDRNLKASITDFHIFNPKMNLNPVFAPYTVILEVKYNRMLPGWLSTLLSWCNGQNLAISKYCISRDLY